MLETTSREYGTAAAPSLPPVLTPQQIATYRERGWLLVRGFVSAPEVAALARWTDELAARPEEAGKHMVYHEPSLANPDQRVIQRIENFCPYHNGFDGFVRHGRIIQATDQLFGTPACLFKEKI